MEHTINPLADILEGAIAQVGGLKFAKPPKEEKQQHKVLIALVSLGADPEAISLSADPAGRGSSGDDHVITVLVGPTSNTVSSDFWAKASPSKFRSNFVRLGQMFREQDRRTKKHTGVLVPRDVRAFKKFYYACACGHVDTVNGLEAESRKFVKACRKCKKAYAGLGDYRSFTDLAEARPALCANEAGKVKVEDHIGNDTIAKVTLGRKWMSIPKDELLVQDGQTLKEGQFIMAGWQEIAPMIRPEDSAYGMLEAEVQMGRRGIFTESQEAVMPQLVGVFNKGRAPGAYEMKSMNEMELIGRYAQMGLEKELRPYKLLAGRPNLVCDWRWIQPAASVGWVWAASLYNAASPHAEAKGHWSPGFYHELAIPNWRR